MIKDVLAEMYTPGSHTRLSILLFSTLSSVYFPPHNINHGNPHVSLQL